jgi:hypothetical protein
MYIVDSHPPHQLWSLYWKILPFSSSQNTNNRGDESAVHRRRWRPPSTPSTNLSRYRQLSTVIDRCRSIGGVASLWDCLVRCGRTSGAMPISAPLVLPADKHAQGPAPGTFGSFEQNNCAICLGGLSRPVELACGHCFCKGMSSSLDLPVSFGPPVAWRSNLRPPARPLVACAPLQAMSALPPPRPTTTDARSADKNTSWTRTRSNLVEIAFARAIAPGGRAVRTVRAEKSAASRRSLAQAHRRSFRTRPTLASAPRQTCSTSQAARWLNFSNPRSNVSLSETQRPPTRAT